MANDDAITARGGLQAVEMPFGAIRKNYYRLTTSAVAVYLGQPMDLDTNGQVVPAASTTGGTSYILGPVLGFSSDASGKQSLPSAMLDLTKGAYLPGNTNSYVCIADDPNQVFVIQEETTAGGQLTSANIGNTISFGYFGTTSGSTTTGYADCELAAGSVSANNSGGALQIIGLADNMNSDGSYNSVGAYAKWRVRIQQHRLGGRVSGTAV